MNDVDLNIFDRENWHKIKLRKLYIFQNYFLILSQIYKRFVKILFKLQM